jgi:hypothetical protein
MLKGYALAMHYNYNVLTKTFKLYWHCKKPTYIGKYVTNSRPIDSFRFSYFRTFSSRERVLLYCDVITWENTNMSSPTLTTICLFRIFFLFISCIMQHPLLTPLTVDLLNLLHIQNTKKKSSRNNSDEYFIKMQKRNHCIIYCKSIQVHGYGLLQQKAPFTSDHRFIYCKLTPFKHVSQLYGSDSRQCLRISFISCEKAF